MPIFYTSYTANNYNYNKWTYIMNKRNIWLAKVSQLVSLLFHVLQLSRDESEAVMTSVKGTRDQASEEQEKKQADQ